MEEHRTSARIISYRRGGLPKCPMGTSARLTTRRPDFVFEIRHEGANPDMPDRTTRSCLHILQAGRIACVRVLFSGWRD